MAAMVVLPQPDTPITTMTDGSPDAASDGMALLRRRGAVVEPHHIALGARAGCRKILPGEYPREDVALICAAHEEQHLSCGCERGKGERHARHERMQAGLIDAHDPALLLGEGRSIRK